MRFHRFCWPLLAAVLLVMPASTPAAADDQPAAQPEATTPDSELDLPDDIPKTEEALAAAITELLRKELGTEPAPERVMDAVARARRIWARAVQRAEAAERGGAFQVAREMEMEVAFLEDLDRGSPVAFLRSLDDRDDHPFDVVGDPQTFATLFERHVEGPAIQWGAWQPGEPLQDGTTLRFPAGTYKIRGRFFAPGHRFPKDLTLEGAGIDQTLVSLRGAISGSGPVYGLTLRDLTIDCGDNDFTNLAGAAIVHLERCRVIGFDTGAGGSRMFDAGAAAFWAEDSVFEAGFGRSPGSGNLFDVRNGMLARLDRCTVQGPFSSVMPRARNSTSVFADCRLLNMSGTARLWTERPREGIRLERCTMTYMPGSERMEYRTRGRRPLSELNPAWGGEAEPAHSNAGN